VREVEAVTDTVMLTVSVMVISPEEHVDVFFHGPLKNPSPQGKPWPRWLSCCPVVTVTVVLASTTLGVGVGAATVIVSVKGAGGLTGLFDDVVMSMDTLGSTKKGAAECIR